MIHTEDVTVQKSRTHQDSKKHYIYIVTVLTVSLTEQPWSGSFKNASDQLLATTATIYSLWCGEPPGGLLGINALRNPN